MFFDGWESIGRIVVLAGATYVLLVAFLRVLGSRALAQMSAYDLVVTVALGSLLANIALNDDVTLTDGFAAAGTYLVLQQGVSWVVARSRRVGRIVKERPHLVVWEGRLLRDRMLGVHVTDEEIRAAVRSAGKASLAEVQAVVLENDGSWSVVPKSDAPDLSAFEGLDVPDGAPARRTDREREVHRAAGRDGSGSSEHHQHRHQL